MTRARDLANSADLTFDGSTLKIDTVNDRVGIGDTLPDNKMNIKESALGSRSASNGNTSLTIEHATDTGIQFFLSLIHI